ncbi:MAG: asparagine synthase (glutamine-hydrolyzing) [Deltaproteobacteria bacterium]|nr:asparagine synthase (glutamine-hydrolyzing) [Deltaproteobacteria bacterium]
MCGIAGVVVPPAASVPRPLLERMTATLWRRGPDDQGVFVDDEGGCGLGHRRLSIIDLSGGHQPLTNDDASIHVVVNGEIYNFAALRAQLEAGGARFRTRSDSEVLVHGYAAWGTEVFRRARGMFAAAIWDGRRRRLALARDPLGKKPLYYAFVDGDTLLFASEAKALLECATIDRAVSLPGLALYLTYECLPESSTIYRGVKKLRPGEMLVFDQARGRAELSTFWTMRFRPRASDFRSATETEVGPELPSSGSSASHKTDSLASELRSRIRDATSARLVADVPLGVFLSGGIDSSTVAAAMASLVDPRTIKTFSITFDDPSFDEGPYARAVAQHLGTDHQEARLSAQEMLDVLPEVADFMCEPLGDASIIPTYLLSRFTRQHVTVALGGDGGDELFFGYPTFQAERVAAAAERILSARSLSRLGRWLHGAAQRLPVSRKNFSFDFKVKRFSQGLGWPTGHRHQAWLGSFLPVELSRLLRPEIAECALRAEPYALIASLWQDATRQDGTFRDADDALVLQYARLYLAGDVLVKVDRASMACGLEVRAPFLDVDLVDFVNAVPGRTKLPGMTTKYLLKQAVRPWLPSVIIDRPKKGFGVPVGEWLRGPLRALARDLLAPSKLKREGFFDPVWVTQLLDEHERGTHDHRKPLWTLLAFELWFERFGRVASAP